MRLNKSGVSLESPCVESLIPSLMLLEGSGKFRGGVFWEEVRVIGIMLVEGILRPQPCFFLATTR
jgi:hypothetical protein